MTDTANVLSVLQMDEAQWALLESVPSLTFRGPLWPTTSRESQFLVESTHPLVYTLTEALSRLPDAPRSQRRDLQGLMETLLNLGVSPDRPCPLDNLSPLHIADTETTRVLLEFGADPEAGEAHTDTRPLFAALALSQWKKARLLIECGASPSPLGEVEESILLHEEVITFIDEVGRAQEADQRDLLDWPVERPGIPLPR
jgi:hypothetical protein